MKKPQKIAKLTPETQSERFIQAAKDAGADESETAFEKKLARLGAYKPNMSEKGKSK